MSGAYHASTAVHTLENGTEPVVMNLAEEQRKETGFNPWLTPLLIVWAETASQCGYVPVFSHPP